MIGLVYALIFYEKVCSYSIPLGLSYYIGKMVVAGEGGWLIFWVPFISDILEYYDSSKTHVKDNKKYIYPALCERPFESQPAEQSFTQQGLLNTEGYQASAQC